MKKIKKVLLLLLAMLLLNPAVSVNMVSAQTEESTDVPEGIVSFDSPEMFTIEGENILIGAGGSSGKMRGLLMNSVTVKSNERIETFANVNSLPHISASIKYIEEDGSYGDGRGPDGNLRRRYVYCLQHVKSTPANQTLTMTGYESSVVYHVIYHGAMYYGETSRCAAHSTGNWRYDYLATQMAIVVVTEQYSLEEVTASIRQSPASATDENLLINAITNMVNDARRVTVHPGFDTDGWFRMDYTEYTSFTLNMQSKTWTLGGDGYYYSDWITPLLTSENGYYANADISLLTNTVTAGAAVEKQYPDSLHSPYRLKISEAQYEEWQATGKTVTSDVSIRVPSHWKIARFSPSGGSQYQELCFPVCAGEHQYAAYEASVSLEIQKIAEPARYTLQITKKNNKDQVLPGAEFTLYSDQECTSVVKTEMTNTDGILTITDLIAGESYYLKETKAPEGYRLPESLTVYKIYAEDSPTSEIFNVYVNDERYTQADTDLSKEVYVSGSPEDWLVNMTIINNTGLLLPNTGSGMTVILMVVGVTLMAGTLLTNKLFNKKKN